MRGFRYHDPASATSCRLQTKRWTLRCPSRQLPLRVIAAALVTHDRLIKQHGNKWVEYPGPEHHNHIGQRDDYDYVTRHPNNILTEPTFWATFSLCIAKRSYHSEDYGVALALPTTYIVAPGADQCIFPSSSFSRATCRSTDTARVRI